MENNHKKTTIPILIVAVGVLAAASFIYKENMDKKNQKTSDTKKQTATDYSKSEHWLSLPVSDDKAVDVFYLYPTSWQKVNQNDPNICDIDNPSMLAGSKSAFSRQATAFEPIGNIYAPYYRQADAAYTLNLPLDQQEKVVGGIPKTDAFAAFDYYIKHYNKGRPFILAGHSQGSNLLVLLLSEYMKEHPEVYKRMIAAYVIGYSVTDDYLAQNPHLKFAEGPADTGVIISYNTEAPTISGKNPVVLPGAIAINPITWSRDETLAAADKNLGSLSLDKDGSPVLDADGKILAVKNYADARVDKAKGVLICSTVDESKLVLGFGPGIYHTYDYPFYFFDIRENAALRTRNFLSKK
jgi:hypothetical protein